MAKYERFEDLPVWQEAARLYNAVLDLLELPDVPLSTGFRNQLDRAALSVSNNIAEGFERATTKELLAFLAIARGSSAEVRSMIAVVSARPKLKPIQLRLHHIRAMAESCARQLGGWTVSIEGAPFKAGVECQEKIVKPLEVTEKAREFRLKFLKNLKPEHPLYRSEEARTARGEAED